MKSSELVNISADIGSSLLKYGGEVYRTQETIERICSTYNLGRIDVFAIPSYVIVNLTNESGETINCMRQIGTRVTDFDKLSRINHLSRHICAAKPSEKTIRRQLSRIISRPEPRFSVELICYAVISVSFALFFGGGIAEAAAAGVIGILLRCLTELSLRYKSGTFFHSLVCSIFTALLAFTAQKLGLVSDYDKVIIGVLMNLVPGVTLTNCMRDFIAGDFLAGVYTLVEAILTALGIALGITVTINLLGYLWI